MENKIQTYIDILKQLDYLTDVEKQLFDVNIGFINNKDQFDLGLKEIGEDGLVRLIQTIHYKHAMRYLLTGNKYNT